MYPHLKTPCGKSIHSVFCAFPSDGGTGGRGGAHACGRGQRDQIGTSEYCHVQGITTYQKWIQHFEDLMAVTVEDLDVRQCAFDMTISTATEDFSVVLRANEYVRHNSEMYAYVINELRVMGWDENKPKPIPIQAFFYLPKSPGAMEKAAKYQDDFYKLSGGEIVPIVGIELPTKTNRNIKIEYLQRNPHNCDEFIDLKN